MNSINWANRHTEHVIVAGVGINDVFVFTFDDGSCRTLHQAGSALSAAAIDEISHLNIRVTVSRKI